MFSVPMFRAGNTHALRLCAVAGLALFAAVPERPVLAADRVVYTVAPNEADPRVRRFLRNSFVLFDRESSSPQAPLLVFFPGTGGDV